MINPPPTHPLPPPPYPPPPPCSAGTGCAAESSGSRAARPPCKRLCTAHAFHVCGDDACRQEVCPSKGACLFQAGNTQPVTISIYILHIRHLGRGSRLLSCCSRCCCCCCCCSGSRRRRRFFCDGLCLGLFRLRFSRQLRAARGHVTLPRELQHAAGR